MLDEELLREYCEGFFGYGNPDGKFWFIGPEEAGGRSEEEVRERLTLWKTKFRKKPIVDGFEFHLGRRYKRQKDPFTSSQKTWDKLARVQLAADGNTNTSHKQVEALKQGKWARSSKACRTCLLELLPLPCPSTKAKDWVHDQWTKKNSIFQTRDCYEQEFFQPRRAGLQGLVGKHKPRVVILYSTGKRWLPLWSAIAGFDWQKVKPIQLVKNQRFKGFFQCHDGTLYVLMHHPSDCWRNAYFDRVGEEIKGHLRRCSGR